MPKILYGIADFISSIKKSYNERKSVVNTTEQKYNIDPEVLHSFIINYNRIFDYHNDVCHLATQLCILSEFFYECNNEYDHNAILAATRHSVIELYNKIYEEDKMFEDCNVILDKITMSE